MKNSIVFTGSPTYICLPSRLDTLL